MIDRRWLELSPQHASGDHVPSPCNSVCRIDASTGWCHGCLRTLDEIADWSTLDARAKRDVWAALPVRFDALYKA